MSCTNRNVGCFSFLSEARANSRDAGRIRRASGNNRSASPRLGPLLEHRAGAARDRHKLCCVQSDFAESGTHLPSLEQSGLTLASELANVRPDVECPCMLEITQRELVKLREPLQKVQGAMPQSCSECRGPCSRLSFDVGRCCGKVHASSTVWVHTCSYFASCRPT